MRDGSEGSRRERRARRASEAKRERASEKAGAARRGDLRPDALAVLVLAAAVALAYANSFGAGFTLDSGPIIRDAARVHDATWANVVDILTSDYWAPGGAAGLYRPLTTLSYLFDWAILGNADRPAGYHAVNLLLQILNTSLVYAIARWALALPRSTGLLIALLFGLHPVATECVTNLIGRADLLAASTVLGGLLLHVAATRAASARARRSLLAALGAVFLVGLLCKESAFILPAVVVLFDLVYRLRRDAVAGAEGRARAVVSEIARLAVPGWLAMLPALVVVVAVRGIVLARNPAPEIPFAENPITLLDPVTGRLTALAALWRGFGLLVWPASLCADYAAYAIPIFDWRLGSGAVREALLAIVASAAAIALALRARRRAPAVAFFVGFFFVAWLPTSNLVVVISRLLAERFLYLPLVGFAGATVLAVEAAIGWLARRASGATRPPADAAVVGVTAVLLGAVAIAYVGRDWARNADWRDDVALWTSALAACPESHLSHEGMATARAAALAAGNAHGGSLDDVIAHAEAALALLDRPGPPGAGASAQTHEKLGSFYFSKAIVLARANPSGVPSARPDDPSAPWLAKALDQFRAAAAIYQAENERRRARHPGRALPDLGSQALFDDLGLASLYAGRVDEARAAFATATERAPWDAEGWQHLADADLARGRPNEALESGLAAMFLEPRRAGLGEGLRKAYEGVDPGGCGVISRGAQVEVHVECPALQPYACRATATLVARLEDSPTLATSQREAQLFRLRRQAAELGCGAR